MRHVACQNISASILPAISSLAASRLGCGRGGGEDLLDCDPQGVVDFA